MVFRGYFKNDAATAEAVNAEGWLHTGDVARWQETPGGTVARELRVVDRKKDIMITAGGRIDILVNAAAEPAGFAAPPTLAEIRGEFFHAELDTKVMGYIRCAREVVPGMREKGYGRIVNISGLASRQTGNTVGSIRNIAVAALTKNLADELGPAGIQVSVVHPGLTRTERTAPLIAARAKAQGVAEAEVEAQMAAGNSIRHLVTAEEVACVVAFLCSPRSRAINGDAIGAGGGMRRSIHY